MLLSDFEYICKLKLNKKQNERNLIVLLTILVCGLTACKPGQKKEEDMGKETKLKIETSAGDITVKLYNETPKHRDNFIKLVEDGTYEDYAVPPCHQGLYEYKQVTRNRRRLRKARCWGQATWVIPFLPNLFIQHFHKKVLCRLHARVMR